MATLIGRGLAPDGALDPSGFAEVLARPRTWRIIRATLVQAGLATAICVAAGVPGAHVLYRRRFPGRDLLRGLVLVPFVLPSVVVGVAFHALVTTGGPLGGGVLGRSLDGTTAIVVAALVFFNYGLVVRTVGTMWSRLDPRAVEAARALGASPWRAWRTVTLPSLAPAIASAASLTFLFCATAYGVVLVLGGPGIGTIETEIYVLTAQYLDLRAAAVLSVLQLAVIAAALWVSERARAASQAALRLRLDVPAPRLRVGDLPALALTLAVALGLLVGPVAVLVARSLRRAGRWTLANYADLGTTGGRNALMVTVWEAAGNSLRVAVVAAGLALMIGTAVSLVVSRRPRSRRLRWGVAALDSVFMLPLGVSAVTVGFGFLITLARPPLALTSSWWILPLAQAVVAVPLVVRTLLPALRAIDPRQREAAAALGAGPGRVLATVDGPHLLRAGGLAAGFALATSLGEFGATSFLARPRTPTLPVVLY
ncbi:MAG: ABC transporter permease, partial [Actinomyces dentalis]